MPANTLQTYTVIGMAENVDDKIYRVTPEETPFVSMIGRFSVDATNPEWLRDSLRVPAANAAIEGADATYAAQTQPVRQGNRTQIIQDTVSVTGTTDRVSKYGRDKESSRYVAKKMVELKKDVELASIANGAYVVGSAGVARQMVGLYGSIATNSLSGATGAAPVVASNTAPVAGTLRAFTEALLKTTILNTYTSGGKCETLMVTPSHKQGISAFTGNVTRFNDVATKNVRLQTSFSVYGHDFGETKVVPNRIMATAGAGTANTAYLLDAEQCKLGVLRPFKSNELAQVGDARNFQVLTEVTLKVNEEKACGVIRDLIA